MAFYPNLCKWHYLNSQLFQAVQPALEETLLGGIGLGQLTEKGFSQG
jgi:hypothetical protein